MQIPEALTILGTLADGADPDTGEVFSSENVCQRPQVLRAANDSDSRIGAATGT